jgi:hypothetical protein
MHRHATHNLDTYGAEAWPYSHEARPPVWDKLVESDHPAGRGLIRLSPHQAFSVHSRLSHSTAALLRDHADGVHHLVSSYTLANPAQELGQCGARECPIAQDDNGSPPVLEQVVVESEHLDGHGTIHLSSEQARYVHARLTKITLAFLHQNAWGLGRRGRATAVRMATTRGNDWSEWHVATSRTFSCRNANRSGLNWRPSGEPITRKAVP